ncbi:MAG: hypothetical protein QOI15_3051 [Pseudonocardiales bacterium]|jgi:hypothetical protein|nr:hypothetical protein [Pseudonocardiales bacterium]MDT4922149.1 hypothetical protein [Pseudonocardiales bacterium]
MTDPRHPSLDELAAGAIDDTDDDVLRRTAAIFEALDPVPAGLVDRINFGLTLEALHAEVAELQRSANLAGVRGDAVSDVQTVTFTSSTLTTMISVTPASGDRVRVDGWIAPAGRISVELRAKAETRQTECDADGRFVFDDVPRGLAQFVLRPEGDEGRAVVTPAIEI